MNERMIELYKQASEFAYEICKQEGRTGGSQDQIWQMLSTGRFAELIIQECGVALRPMLRDMISRGKAHELIKQHFGFE